MFGYDYVPEEELSAYRIIGEGEGEFRIDSAVAAISKKNIPMLKLVMTLKDSKGNKTLADEYISSKAAFKLHDLCDAIGKPEMYGATGKLNEKLLVGQKGGCVIVTEQPDDPKYRARSVIGTYIASMSTNAETPPQAAPAATVDVAVSLMPDDDVPF